MKNGMTTGRVLAAALVALLFGTAPVAAQVSQLNAWALRSSTNPADPINVTTGTITVSAGTGRLLVVAAVLETSGTATIANFNATVGGQAMTAIATTQGTSAQDHVKMWYLLDASFPTFPAAINVQGTLSGNNTTGLDIYWASFAGVDQTSPIFDSNANFNSGTTVGFGNQIDYTTGGIVFYAAGNGGSTVTHTPPAGFTQDLLTQANNQTTAVADTGVLATTSNFLAGTTVTFGGGTNRTAIVVASLRPTPTADVSIVKTITPPFTPGSNFNYVLTVTNNSPSFSATNVTVTDTQPSGVTFGTTVASQGTCAGTTPKTCSLGTLAAGSSATITITALTASNRADVTNTATVSATEPDPDLTNNSSTVSTFNTADVAISKTATASTTIGGNITYTLTVTNNGGTPPNTANLVTVTDPLPTGTTFVSATTTVGSCSGTAVVTCNLGNMVSGATETITIVATNNSAGTKGNTATVSVDTSTTYDPNPTNNSSTATTAVTGAGSAAPVCNVPNTIGAGGVLSGIVNTYYPGTATAAAGASSITLGAARGAPAAQVPIAVGDLILVIQMQDATINATNTNNYGGNNGTGAGATANNAGKYEFVRASNAVPLTGGTLNLAGSTLVNTYTDANATTAKGQSRFQVVRGLEYTTATLNGVTAAPWLTDANGRGTGAVLALDIAGTLTFNSGTAAGVDGLGFRGAAGRQLTGGGGANTDWRTLSTVNANGGKGEGNAGTPEWVYDPSGAHTCGSGTNTYLVNTGQPNDGYPNGSMAQGAPGSAGGGSTDGNPTGANDQNSGGGGGSNGGAGGTGGLTWSTYINNGGKGAAVIPAISQLVPGGGGGAGTRNNDNCGNNGATAAMEGQASSGAAGGGIIFLRANDFAINAGAIVSANGSAAYDDTLNDGGGGGGAGGSIVLEALTGGMAGLTAQATGGKGGSTWKNQGPGSNNAAPDTGNNRHGPGGGGGGGVIAYSSPATPPTMVVTGGASGISTTANDPFGAQAGAIGQTLIFAAGQIPGVGTAAECAFDPAITLTHNPATQSSGANVAFVATVTNVGPFTTTTGTMSVTITIDSGLTFVGANPASGTGWTCAAAVGQSVTCTHPAGLAAQASYPSITFSATVNVTGPATLSNNTAVVTNPGDSNATNNTATDVVGVRAPTLARLRSFHALPVAEGVQLQWQTSFEAHNLGFRIYRETNGVRQLLTPSVIAGSALFVGKQVMSSGRRYSWVDTEPGADPVYWLEDIDINGARNWTGPVFPDSRTAVAPLRHVASEVRGGPAASSPTLRSLGHAAALRTPKAAAGIGFERRARTPRVLARRTATGPAAKIFVDQEGWYRLSKTDLLAAGFDPGSDPSRLALFAAGEEQAIEVHDGGDGRFDPSDTVEFYGLGFDSPWDASRVYWLTAAATGRQARIPILPPGFPFGTAPTSFPFTVERKDRALFFTALTGNGDDENFFGDLIGPDPATEVLSLTHLATGEPVNATLTLALQGVTTDTPHDVDIAVNGQDLGHIRFSQMEHPVRTFTFPSQWLHEGDNDILLTPQGGANDISLVDYIHLTYPHLYQLDGGALRMQAPAHGRITIGGLADTALRVVDVTHPDRPRELSVRFADPLPGPIFSASVAVPDNETAVLYAFEPDRVLSPAGIVRNNASNLRGNNEADMVVIAHASLMDSLKPLQAARNAQGLATSIVDVTDVYDEFAWGQKTPYALREFLLRTRSWKKRPHFVLLAGDASFDPKNHLGMGDFDLVPTKLVPTFYFKTDSDDWFVDFNEDGLPDLAVGRLPARTPEEAGIMVTKILAHDAAITPPVTDPTNDWRRRVLFVADQPDEFDFDAASVRVRALVPSGFVDDQLFVSQLGAATHQAIVDSIDKGRLIVNYVGHGSEDVWSQGGIYSGGDALGQTNGARLPLVVDMTCLNGLFDDLYVESLAESFLKAPNGGAVAVWASSSLTEPQPQSEMNQALFRRLFQDPPMSLGDAVAGAKAATADLDVRRTWILFGDPSMRLR